MGRWLIGQSKFKGQALEINMFKIINQRRVTLSVLTSSLILASGLSFDAHALGVGAAETDSYIGEPLSVRIPLFNVVDPSSLSINFESQQFDGEGQAKVSATLDRSNSQLSIKLGSDSVINEPYISFTLGLVDSSAEFSKEFIVLMDLRIEGSELDQSEGNTNVITGKNFALLNSQSVPVDGRIMGPYDTAQAGRIPEKFGAVLDGQSLWRVARRINGAMGVSKSQMMWSLYQANPDAFSSRSVSSLKAGIFLTIPNESTVKNVSDAQAKANLAALRSDGQGDLQQGDLPIPVNNSAVEEFGLVNNAQTSNQEKTDASPFQVTGIDSAGQKEGVSDEAQSQNIIATLTETVGNLSQQLDRRDQKIEFLEKQVTELKYFIGEEALTDSIPEDSSALDSGTSSATPLTVVTPNSASETKLVQEPPSVRSSESGLANGFISTAKATPIWQWALLCFFAFSILAYVMRDRLYRLGQSLKLFGYNDQVEFNSIAEEEPLKRYKGTPHEPKLESAENVESKDYSVMNAVEKNMSDNDVLDGISYLDLADDGTYETNSMLEFESEDVTEEVEDQSFDERFERLLVESDFKFARELLDFARHNEINDERYHCERLRLYEKMKDEDGFYEYYYEIESEIPTFPPNIQTRISQLVVHLAHS